MCISGSHPGAASCTRWQSPFSPPGGRQAYHPDPLQLGGKAAGTCDKAAGVRVWAGPGALFDFLHVDRALALPAIQPQRKEAGECRCKCLRLGVFRRHAAGASRSRCSGCPWAVSAMGVEVLMPHLALR